MTTVTASSPAPEDRMSKRVKQVADDHNDGLVTASSGPSQQQHPPPKAQHYNGVAIPPHPPPPPNMPPGGYYGPPPLQYPNHHGPPPPPHHHQPWQGQSLPPSSTGSSRYPPPPPQRGLSPDRGPSWSQQHGGYRESSSPAKGIKSKQKRERGDDPYYAQQQPGPPPPPPGYQGPPPPPGYGPPPPSHWQPGPSPPPPMYTSQGTWTGKSPPRTSGSSSTGRPMLPRDPYHHRQHHQEMDMPSYMSQHGGQESVDDDGNSSTADSNRDKGRGSYKCGRCGVPKKGHVCPYQPKLKRRPDEPEPQTRNAAVQVEMDEFMTLRRLNIRIQGFPESYATEPYMTLADATLNINEASSPPLSHIHHPHLHHPPPHHQQHPAAIVGEPIMQYHQHNDTIHSEPKHGHPERTTTKINGAALSIPPEISSSTIPHNSDSRQIDGEDENSSAPEERQRESRDTGVGDDPVYGENENNNDDDNAEPVI